MHDRGSSHSTPRWVTATGIIVIGSVLLFVSLHLIGGSFLGHSFSAYDDQAPASSATEHGLHQP